MNARPFRFGVSLRAAANRAEWRARAKRAEALGFDVILVADHVDGVFPPLTALCTAAEAAPGVRVGTYVANNDFRHPVQLAREAATVDLLTDGRLELGLGAGHMGWEYEQTGVPFEDAPTRVARLGEAVAIVRGLLDGETVSLDGSHYNVRGHRLSPRPVQRHVPLLIGGNGRRLLALAGRWADIVSFTGFTPIDDGRGSKLSHFTAAGLASRIEIVRAAAGERVDALELNVLVQAVVEGPGAAAAALPLLRRMPGLSAAEAQASPFLLLGTHEEMANALLQRRAELGVSYVTVFEEAMESLAPVIERVKEIEPRY